MIVQLVENCSWNLPDRTNDSFQTIKHYFFFNRKNITIYFYAAQLKFKKYTENSTKKSWKHKKHTKHKSYATKFENLNLLKLSRKLVVVSATDIYCIYSVNLFCHFPIHNLYNFISLKIIILQSREYRK